MITTQRPVSFPMVCMKDIFPLFYSWHDVINNVIFFTSNWNILENLNFKSMVVMWLLISIECPFQWYINHKSVYTFVFFEGKLKMCIFRTRCLKNLVLENFCDCYPPTKISWRYDTFVRPVLIWPFFCANSPHYFKILVGCPLHNF